MLRRIIILLKIIIWKPVGCSVALLCAAFCLTGFIACSDTAKANPVLSDIFAVDVSVKYDGKPHTISVSNTIDSDTVLFSVDNITFSATAPAFTDVGVYTVYFKVIRVGYAEFSSSATVAILPIVLSGISASNISVVYDGNPHCISIVGALDSDGITYSTDGFTFSSAAPSFTDVGEYTVYYRVTRPYGEYASSCYVTIFPYVYGRYFNPSYGVIVLSEANTVITDISGNGYVDGNPFSVTGNVLSYMDLQFTLLSDDDYVYRLVVQESSVLFCATATGTLYISFSDGSAVINLGADALLSVPNFNYCESGVITDYVDLCFEQAFSCSSDITDITVYLSTREVNPITVDCVYFTYDGKPHGFNFGDDVVFLSDETEFTDVGIHTVTAVFLSETYLPRLLELSLVILPDVEGVYVSDPHAILIADGVLSFDDAVLGELTVHGDGWVCNDLPITVTEDGISYDGVSYTSTTDTVIVVRVNGEAYAALTIPKSTLQIDGTYDGTKLDLTVKDTLLLSIPLSGTVTAALNGIPLKFLSDGHFVLGRTDILAPIVVLDIFAE